MAKKSAGPKLVIAISSTALFDMRESHSIFENEGVAAYAQYQREHEDDILEPGEAFPLATKLLRINEKLGCEPSVEIILLSRNSADTGLRVFNSIAHHGLNISRAAFSGGNSPYRYVSAFACHLFLSTHAEDVRSALDSGMAAATLLPRQLLCCHPRVAPVSLMSCALPLMGMLCCFQMPRSGSLRSADWMRLLRMRKRRPTSPWIRAPLKTFFRHCMRCSQNFPTGTVRFEPHW